MKNLGRMHLLKSVLLIGFALTSFVGCGGSGSGNAVVSTPTTSLDKTFHANGTVMTQFGTGSSSGATVNAVVVQSDGKIVAAGGAWTTSLSGTALARYNSDGSIDETFGQSGKVVNQAGGIASAVAIQSDGKIVVAGERHAVVQAITNSQFLDVRFVGDFTLDRFNPDGTLDTTFNASRTANMASDAKSLIIQGDGKIVVAAGNWLFRYNTDGSLDTSFGANGEVSTDIQINAIAKQVDGKIVAGGNVGPDNGFALVRYNADGSLDNSFGANGKVVTAVGTYTAADPTSILGVITKTRGNVVAIAIQQDGKIVAVGNTHLTDTIDHGAYDLGAVVRYNSDGSLDKNFNGNGMNIVTSYSIMEYGNEAYKGSVAIQEDGKIVVAGFRNYGVNGDLLRFNTDGSVDSKFVSGRMYNYTYMGADAVAIQPDGKIVAGLRSLEFESGSIGFAITRCTP